MRREERVTVQDPVKQQQPDGMSHRGGGLGTCGGHGGRGKLWRRAAVALEVSVVGRGSCFLPAKDSPTDALEGKGPERWPQNRLGRRLEGFAKAVGGGYCRLHMPVKPALGCRGQWLGVGWAPWKGGGIAGQPLNHHPHAKFSGLTGFFFVGC